GLQPDRQPALRIDAEFLVDIDWLLLAILRAAVVELPGKAAFRIVRAADESAELADLQAELAVGAGWAFARVTAVCGRRKDERAENLVDRIEDLRDTQLLDVVHRIDEVAPEIAQDLFPRQLAVRDQVELFLQIRREVILDIAVEEAFEKGCDQPSLVLRN